jgi:DNA polymerase III epsilon subunit-like protein
MSESGAASSAAGLNSVMSGISNAVAVVVLFDLETNAQSWKSNCIVQVGAMLVSVADGVLLPYEQQFNEKVMLPPGKRMSKGATAVHGLKAADVNRAAGALPCVDVLKKFIRFVELGCHHLFNDNDDSDNEDDEDAMATVASKQVALVAHNGIGFDFRVLLRHFGQCGLEWPKNWMLLLDTLSILRGLCMSKGSVLKLPAARGKREVAISRASGLDLGTVYKSIAGNTLSDAHDALADTKALYVLFKALTSARPEEVRHKKAKRGILSAKKMFAKMKSSTGFADGEQMSTLSSLDDSEDEGGILVDYESAASLAESDLTELNDVGDGLEWREVEASALYGGKGRREPTRPDLDTLTRPFLAGGQVADGKMAFRSPLTSFLHFFRDAAALIIVETNRYAHQKMEAKQKEEKEERRRQRRASSTTSSTTKSARGDDKGKGKSRKRVRRRQFRSRSSSSSSADSSRGRKKRRKHAKTWEDVDMDELLDFVSCLLVLGVVGRKSRRQEIWSNDLDFAVPRVQATMTRARFEQILAHLHFVDNETLPARDDPQFNPAGKVQPLIDCVNKIFRCSFCLGLYVSADECSKGFCGRVCFRKSMKHKPIVARFGFNIFSVHCAHTAYMYQFAVQHGSLLKMCQQQEPKLAHINNLHSMIPLFLLRDYIDGNNNAHAQHKLVIVCDRLYTSFRLAKESVALGFNVLGTVRSGGAGMPPKSWQLKDKEKGQMKLWKLEVPKGCPKELHRLKGILAINYCDSRSFLLLSTIPSDNFKWDPRHVDIPLTKLTIPRRRDGEVKQQPAPNLVAVYNSKMNGADVFDASWNRCEIGFSRMRKWTVVLFFAVLDFIVENSRIAYNWFAEKKLSPAQFRLKLADALVRPAVRERLNRLAGVGSAMLNDARRVRDSPLPIPRSPTGRFRVSTCAYGNLGVKNALACSTTGCPARTRSGCKTHSKVLCVDCYAHIHVPSSTRSKRGAPIAFSLPDDE